MKKIISLLLILCSLTLCFTACSEPDNTQIRVGYLTGPTGMGMAKLIHDNGGVAGNEKYSFVCYTAPTEAAAALAAGKIDLICIDTNGAADYFNKYTNAEVLSINTLSSLFIVTDKNTTVNSFAELDGKTVYTCKAGTPKPITDYLVSKASINVTVSNTFNGKVIASPQELGALLTEGSIDIAVVPEPILTSSLMTIKANSNTEIEYSIDIPLSTVWDEYADTDSPMAMGCLIGNSEFVKAHKSIVKNFLNEYKSSIEFANNLENLTLSAEYVAEAKIMGAAKPAETALKNLNGAIAYIDGKEMKKALEAFYTALGVTLPNDEFYYDK
ncbi:MAG: ABC transporter substrate-binding protein [Clostridia bacterium]|nr:ABC transporter substrate-binding protein [Clostridia bacterium]